jgi:hypothetical protein
MKRTKKLSMLFLCFTLLFSVMASGMAGAHQATTSSGAADFRVAVDRLLAEHGMLAVIAMQKGIDGAPDFGDAAGALNENTNELSAAIGSVYGEEAGAAFKKMWNDHIGFFVDYVVATASNDEEGRKAALAKLDDYRFGFAKFLAGANPNLNADALAAGLQMHVNQLVSAFDNYVNKDYKTAYASIRETYAHMFMTGDALSAAIVAQFPAMFNNTVTTGAAVDFRVAVDRLLAEHGLLAVIAMQKGISGSADFADAAGALNENTNELSAAIGSVYGEEAGAAFKKMWNDHIGFFVDYVVATASNDEEGRKAALAKLDDYRFGFAKFLAGANPNLNADALAEGLQMHVNQLVSAFDSYVNKDYKTAYASVRETYAHMFMTGDALSAAIVAQFPDKFHDAHQEEAVQPSVSATITASLKIGSSLLQVNDSSINLDVAPFILNGRTFVSLRSLSEAVGAEVIWDGKKTVWVKSGGNTATFWFGESYMEWNGMKKEIGSKVFVKDGRTQIPLRFIAELLGWTVEYNQQNWTVKLSK